MAYGGYTDTDKIRSRQHTQCPDIRQNLKAVINKFAI